MSSLNHLKVLLERQQGTEINFMLNLLYNLIIYILAILVTKNIFNDDDINRITIAMNQTIDRWSGEGE